MLRETRTDRKISMWHRMQKNINHSATSIKILSCIISKLCTFVIKRVHCSYRIPITIQTTNYEKQPKQTGQNRSTNVFISRKSVRSYKISKWHSLWQRSMVQIVAKKTHQILLCETARSCSTWADEVWMSSIAAAAAAAVWWEVPVWPGADQTKVRSLTQFFPLLAFSRCLPEGAKAIKY